MAFDGFFTKKIVAELNEQLKFGKINKINNISNNDFIFTIRKNSNKKLIISANPQSSRIHITKSNYTNPQTPSNFCTVLRKYLSNGYVLNFEQINNDRIIFIHIKNNDELGYEKYFYLIIELMGKHANIILTDSNKIIIDAIKNNYDIEYSRSTIANIEYKLPPTKEKYNPFDKNSLNIVYNEEDKKFLMNNFYGVSSLINNYCKNINNFSNFINNFEILNEPTYFENGNKKDFYFFNIADVKEVIKFDNYSELLDFYYLDNIKLNNNKQTNKKIYLFVENKINRLNNKVTILKKELETIKNDDKNELKGQLLLANNYLFKKYIPKEVKLQNFYSENLEEITIELDENLTIEQNAEKYFNISKKNKRTIKNILEQLEIANNEIEYFENINVQLENANNSDIEEIKEELINQGYLKTKISKKNKKTKYTIVNYNDFQIYVGKNNIQNSTITHKLANKNYLWFHAKDIPGSHVVIFSNSPDNDTIKVAAMLAGYFSKNKNESYVNVDYTLIKYVKKISGAKEGMVTYTNQTTIKIKIDKILVNNLL